MHVEIQKSIPNLGAFLGDRSSLQKVKMKGSMVVPSPQHDRPWPRGQADRFSNQRLWPFKYQRASEAMRLGHGGGTDIISKPMKDVM